MSEHTTELYFEVHITIDPVFDEQRRLAAAIGLRYGFKMAELIMRKETGDTEKPHQDGAFFTARTNTWHEARGQTVLCVEKLKRAGFNVRRYKIENTLVDSRMFDTYGLLR